MNDVDWPMWPTATVPLASPGLLVGDRYQLFSQIGVGAMGAVWLGTDQRLGRAVALKQVVLGPGLDPRQATEARQRILREGRIAARLQHPHAVSIYDVTMHEGEPWLVMEYVPSRSLARILTEDGLLVDGAAARIGQQLADALQAAHRAGIVHRDVKPGNVLVARNGTVKLGDFGIARASGDITVTQTGVLTGTPDYFAPEVARGGEPTPEADVFALGATLYICVEGVPPFGGNPNALIQMQVIADGKVRPPRQAGRLTPVLEQLLAVDPAARPTALRAATLLGAIAHGKASESVSGGGPTAVSESTVPGPTNGLRVVRVPGQRPLQDGTPEPLSAPVPKPLSELVPEPRTTRIPPPRSAPESWLPWERALPPTPRELAAIEDRAAAANPTGRAAHRMPGLEARRRHIVIALAAMAALAVVAAFAALVVALLSASGRENAPRPTPPASSQPRLIDQVDPVE